MPGENGTSHLGVERPEVCKWAGAGGGSVSGHGVGVLLGSPKRGRLQGLIWRWSVQAKYGQALPAVAGRAFSWYQCPWCGCWVPCDLVVFGEVSRPRGRETRRSDGEPFAVI